MYLWLLFLKKHKDLPPQLEMLWKPGVFTNVFCCIIYCNIYIPTHINMVYVLSVETGIVSLP